MFSEHWAPHDRHGNLSRRTTSELSEYAGEEDEDAMDLEDILKDQEDPIEEDTYGYVIACIIRDIGRLEKGTGKKTLRIFRLISALLLLFVTIGLQMLIIYFVRQLLTATAVHGIRDSYSEYERLMYPNHTSLIFHYGGGAYHRGTDIEYRVAANFALLDDDAKDALCAIPLSQPLYLCTVLLIWSLTCMYQLRLNYEQFYRLVLKLKTIRRMDESTKQKPEDPSVMIVGGLTMSVKLALVMLVFLPQAAMTCTLCWLGCRWMTATADLQSLLTNAVALEFVLMLKEVLYKVLVPRRSKMEMQSTYIEPDEDAEEKDPTIISFFSSFGWGIVATAWVLFYVLYLQNVLVEYRWDVADICDPFLMEQRMV